MSLLLASAPAQAQPADEFYRGKTVTIDVGASSGGTYDLYARLLARHMGKHLPGQPTIVVRNMPGAGGLTVANHIYSRAPKDGTELAVFARGLVTQKLFDQQGPQFDSEKFGWIGTPTREVSVVFAWATKPFKSLQDLRERTMLVAATATGADSAVIPFVLNGLLGTKFKVVTGYPGSNETLLAVERGEVDGSGSTSWSNFASSKQSWIAEKKVTLLLQLGLKKHPALPDVPLAIDEITDPIDRRAMELVLLRQEMAYPFTAPPELAPARLQLLRRAFDLAMADSSLKQEAAQQGLELDPIGGERIATLVQQAFNSAPEIPERARAALAAGAK